MKKLLLLIPLIFMTGCTKRIICKSSDEANSVTQSYNIYYKKDTISKIISKKTYKFNDNKNFENFENIIKYSVMSSKQDNIKSSYKKEKNKYILNEEFEISKMQDDLIEIYGLSKSKKEFVSNLENQRLICK